MYVLKRDGSRVKASFDEIATRIRNLCRERNLAVMEDDEKPSKGINVEWLTQKTIAALPHEKDRTIKTTEIDALSAELAEYMATEHSYSYHQLAGFLLISSLHKDTPKTFSESTHRLAENDPEFLDPAYVQFVMTHAKLFDMWTEERRDWDYTYDYFSIGTLRKGYLLSSRTGETLETPQYMHMRVAICLGMPNLDLIQRNYQLFSAGIYTHATPTLLNAGKRKGQYSSCFLLETKDNIEAIFQTVTECALISKKAGGIGLSVTRIRSKGRLIKSSRGPADGLPPLLRVLNATGEYVNQVGHRKGAISVYFEPWHPDIFDVLELKSNEGDENKKCRALFFGLWIPDLFMKRVEADQAWSLFSPDQVPDLPDVYGSAFEARYTTYESILKPAKVVQARELWFAILKAQCETGGPYMLYKDHCNRKSNQKNIGVIQSSNLCTEICQVAKHETEIANCNLASIALPAFVNLETQTMDLARLRQVCGYVVETLNHVIDRTSTPTEKCTTSNQLHRPLGIGVQGLANVFMLLKMPYESPEAQRLNRIIFEHIYYGCLEASAKLAAEYGPYSSFLGSPASKGQLQPDLWDLDPTSYLTAETLDWGLLRALVAKHGLRNSLLVALMPTASTSGILGNVESFEPLNSNLYIRRTQTAEYCLLNKHLVAELETLGLWTPKTWEQIRRDKGSVKNIPGLPQDLKQRFKTVWEMNPKNLVQMAADRAPWICQSQSFNCFLANPTFEKLSAYHFMTWKKGLKTGLYYLRSKPAIEATDVSVSVAPAHAPASSAPVCPLKGGPGGPGGAGESCVMCSS